MFDMRLIPRFAQIISQQLNGWTAKLCALACACALSACSLAVSGYNNAPQLLMFLWIDPHFNLTKAQKEQTLADLRRIQQWHRQKQLPEYANLLLQFQKATPGQLSADQMCVWVDRVADLMEELVFQFEEPMARLALSLNAAQLQTLKLKYAEDLKDYRKEWKLDGSANMQLNAQTEKGQSNAERLYGRLTPIQQKLLRQLAQNAGFDGERTFAERLRLQNEQVAVFEQIALNKPSLEQAQLLVRTWMQNSIHSPDASYAAYLKKRKQANCEAAASLHNATSDEQRAKAVKVLKAYEEDVRTLMKQSPG